MKQKLLLFLMALLPMAANAYDAEIDGIYYNFNGDEAIVTYQSYDYLYRSNYSGAVEIPKTVIYNGKSYNVTSIGDYAFDNCKELTSVTIPNGVTDIGLCAFRNCSSLTSVTIPNSVTSIGSAAFKFTAWYDNQPDGVVYAGKVAYSYKGSMPEGTEIVLEEGILTIADFAFRDCSNLSSVTIPNSVTHIGKSAFEGCNTLSSVTFGYSVASIGSSAFRDCSNLSSVIIPNSMTHIGQRAFKGCTGLTSVTIPESVVSIGYGAFYGCI